MNDIHRDAFKQEAYELLEALESTLLELEAAPDNSELIGAVFRQMHTIKGSGAMFGFDNIASFTHQVETVYDHVRSGRIEVTRELVNLTLKAADQIKYMLDSSENETDLNLEEALVIETSFRKLLPVTSSSTPVPAITLPPPGSSAEASPAKDHQKAYFIRFKPCREIFISGTNPIVLFRELAELGQLTITARTAELPPLDELDPELCYISWDILLISDCELNAVKDVFIFVEDDCELTIKTFDGLEESGEELNLGQILLQRGDISREALDQFLKDKKKIGEQLADAGLVPMSTVESALVEQQKLKSLRRERPTVEQQSSIRVPSERLDHLVNLVGQQVTVQARLGQLAQSLRIPELKSISEEVARLTAELRDSTLNIRMLPIGATFGKFKRLVRDLSGELGKEIELTTSGEETELDKTVIEKLNDPLVHMIRNCCDHAIGVPEARIAEGKPRHGTIHLSAQHSGDSVQISIRDDGSGLKRDTILNKALEKGLVSRGAELSDKEVFALIFAPGFSTAQTVTSVSGRGVGMDVVKRSIEELRGSIDIQSHPGVGTTITVSIPLTLAIIESLLVVVGDDQYMFPLSLVEECMFLTQQDKNLAHGRQVIDVRGKIIPYIQLRKMFDTTGDPPSLEQLVITSVDGNRVGFVVDNIIGQHQTVIKALGNTYKNVEGVSGATILGSGSVALILDVPKLYQTANIEEQIRF